jgi:hypothetical protein
VLNRSKKTLNPNIINRSAFSVHGNLNSFHRLYHFYVLIRGKLTPLIRINNHRFILFLDRRFQ